MRANQMIRNLNQGMLFCVASCSKDTMLQNWGATSARFRVNSCFCAENCALLLLLLEII